MPKYMIHAYVLLDGEVIEADSEEEAVDTAWEQATRELNVSVELMEDEDDL